jgi:4-hydroxybenzoate polyprenyltransferase
MAGTRAMKILEKLLDGLFLLRISLLAPVWTIVILGWITTAPDARLGGWLLAGGAGLAREAALWISLAGFSFVVASIYVVNQIVDVDSDRINHKLFLLPHGFISIRVAWLLAAACVTLGVGISVVFLDGFMTLLFVVSLVLGGLYNLPPVALKNRAWGGAVANFLGHGTATYLVGWHAVYLGMAVDLGNLGVGLLASLSAGFANAAIYVTTTIADAEGDKATGKRTFCVVYGEKTTAIVASLSCFCALLFAFFLPRNQWVMVLPAAASLLFFGYLLVSTTRRSAFWAFKWPVFLLSAIVALYVPLYALLVFLTFFGSRLYYRRRFGIEYPTFKAQ